MFWNKKKTEPSSGFTKSTKSGFSSDDGGSSDEKLSRWSLLSNPVVSHNALIWFSEMKPTEFAGNSGKDELRVHEDFIKGIDISLQDLAETSFESDFQYLVSTLRDFAERFNPQVFPEMEVNLGSCDQVEIRDSDLGQKIISALESQGVSYIETSELGIDEEASGLLIRWHDTDAGHPNLQYLRVYEDPHGVEFAYWHTHLLASNRPIDYRYVPKSKGGKPFSDLTKDYSPSPEGTYNLKWVLPSLLKNLAFLAENPLRSAAGDFTFTRNTAFNGASPKSRPKPAFVIGRHETIGFTHDEGEWPFGPIKPPHSVLFGWVITRESLKEIEKVIPAILEGCSFALNVLEEGEREGAGVWTGLDWHMALRQPAALTVIRPEVYEHRFPPSWMTIPEYSRRHAYIWSQYDDAYNLPSSIKRIERFNELIENCTDRFVLHAANSLVFGEYLDSVITSEEELETAIEVLAMAFSLDPDNDFGECQATNSLTNLGALYYQAGKLGLAEESLNSALERALGEAEGGSEAEINLLLSFVYEELGEPQKAAQHRELGSSFESAQQFRAPGSKESALTSNLAKYGNEKKPSELGELLAALEEEGLELRPGGFFNVEGGDVAIRTQYFDNCDSGCGDFLGPAKSNCDECGRSPERYIRIPAGDGDGVYVIFEIYQTSKPKFSVGALVIFDHNYGIADAVRDPILEERYPEVPMNLILERKNAVAVDLGELGPSDKVLLSEALATFDSQDASISVNFEPAQRLAVFAFVDVVSSDPELEAERLHLEAGMDRQFVLKMLEEAAQVSRLMAEQPEEFGELPQGHGKLPNFVFRGLLVLTKSLAEKISVSPRQGLPNWETLTAQFQGKINTSHAEPMSAAAIWFNVLLKREEDRAAGDVDGNEAKRLLSRMLTWAYQGAVNGDDDCVAIIESTMSQHEDEVTELLLERGLKEAAQAFQRTGLVGKAMVRTENSGQDAGSARTAKAGSAPRQTLEPAKFCGGCGAEFPDVAAKFCSGCGRAR